MVADATSADETLLVSLCALLETEWFLRSRYRRPWGQPADIKARYRSASVLKSRRVVFNIKGNEYRLIVGIAYKLQVVYVKFVGTHEEYDAIDAETVEMT